MGRLSWPISLLRNFEASASYCLRLRLWLGSSRLKRSEQLLLFCALAILGAFDIHAAAHRALYGAADPIDWAKVILAIFLQIVGVYLGLLSVRWFKHARERRSIVWTFRLYWVPIAAAGLLAAYSVTILFNGINCGGTPVPTNRGMPTCAIDR